MDPLRSIAKQEPEFGAFRVYPPAYTAPVNLAPDGSTGDKDEMQIRWGPVPGRYYQLGVSYFMSSLGNKLLGVMSKNNLWVRVLSSSAMLEPETRERFPERVSKAVLQIDSKDVNGRGKKGKDSALAQGVRACSELAIEQCKVSAETSKQTNKTNKSNKSNKSNKPINFVLFLIKRSASEIRIFFFFFF